MNECEQVIVLDVCCTIKRPTTMCLAKKKKKKKEREKKKVTPLTGLTLFRRMSLRTAVHRLTMADLNC